MRSAALVLLLILHCQPTPPSPPVVLVPPDASGGAAATAPLPGSGAATAPPGSGVATAPPPGSGAGATALPDATSPDTACSKDEECGIDNGETRCFKGGEPPFRRRPDRGAYCLCEASRCAIKTWGPLACDTWKDCSWTRNPYLRPISSKEVPRPKSAPVRPCKNGEFDSVCEANGTGGKVCRIVAWKC